MSAELWFRAKRYGWGWTPVTWQGWAVVAVYVVLVAGWFWFFYRTSGGTGPALHEMWPVALLTAAVIAVCWRKGERPRWRWGK